MSKRIPAATAAMHEIRLCHLGMPLRSRPFGGHFLA
jgi:hypothetical protein